MTPRLTRFVKQHVPAALDPDGDPGFWSGEVFDAIQRLQPAAESYVHNVTSSPWAGTRGNGSKRRSNGGKKKAPSRAQKENAVAGKFPPGSKQGRGAKRVVFLIGGSARVLGQDDYTVMRLADLSDADLDKLYRLLVLR